MKNFTVFERVNNTQHVATPRTTVTQRAQHVAPYNVAICCVEMLRSFGRGLTFQTLPRFCWLASNGSFNTWLHTRACMYNLSALGTHFECEGVKCTFRTSLSDHGNVDQRSRSAPPSVIYTTLENARPMGNGSQLKAMCSVATILMNGTILVNNLNVIFIDNLNHRSSYGHPTSNAVLQITNQLLRFHVSTS